jgi:hypothetical protein
VEAAKQVGEELQSPRQQLARPRIRLRVGGLDEELIGNPPGLGAGCDEAAAFDDDVVAVRLTALRREGRRWAGEPDELRMRVGEASTRGLALVDERV